MGDDMPAWAGLLFEGEAWARYEDYLPLVIGVASPGRAMQVPGRETKGYAYVNAPEGERGMIELKLGLDTGRFLALVVVNMPEREAPPQAGDVPVDHGLPLFAGGGLRDGDGPHIRQVVRPLSSRRDGGATEIRIGDAAPDRRVDAGGAWFLFSGRTLAGFGAVPARAEGAIDALS